MSSFDIKTHIRNGDYIHQVSSPSGNRFEIHTGTKLTEAQLGKIINDHEETHLAYMRHRRK